MQSDINGVSPHLNISDIMACDIRHWYPMFKQFTIPTEFVNLTEPFIDFILDGNLFITSKSNCFAEWSDYSSDERWDEEDNNDDEIVENAIDSKQFEDIRERIAKVISKYEYIFPRFNWSSPSVCFKTKMTEFIYTSLIYTLHVGCKIYELKRLFKMCSC